MLIIPDLTLFGNNIFEENYMISINGMNINRV